MIILVVPLFAQNLNAQETTPKWPLLTPSKITLPLPGTSLLTDSGDLSRALLDTNGRFLDGQIDRAQDRRNTLWKRDISSHDTYLKSVAPHREHLEKMLGLDRDERYAPEGGNRLLYRSTSPKPFASGQGITVHEVSWRAFGDVYGYGFLLQPEGEPLADIVAIPDAEAASDEVIPPWTLKLAQSGCRVLVPRLIDREENEHKLSHREWIQRPAFILGRTLIGYEVQKIRAGIDCLLTDRGGAKRPLGVIGYGEGGLIALYSGALDTRIDCTSVSGYFGPRKNLWKEPADRNIFGLLREFGDAEIASLVTPRSLIIEHGKYPAYGYRAGSELELDFVNRGKIPGKPGFLPSPTSAEVEGELARLREWVTGLNPAPVIELVEADTPISDKTLKHFLTALGQTSLQLSEPTPMAFDSPATNPEANIAELVAHNQWALGQSAADRRKFFGKLKTDSHENFAKTIEPYREIFREEVIGDFELPLLKGNPRTRPYHEGPKTISYEVVLDVIEDGGVKIFTYGILTLPKDLDLASGEKRPVVVCQHGLEGSPEDVVGEGHYKSYKAFATRLAERGFITFAPQNGYKYFDLFRMQQFKAQSLGKTLFSLIVPQHRQITDWLAAQPWVDAKKIAFYGLSYGGKSAMRIPPLVDRYCLSICSGDFNEWVWKNAATDEASLRYSYANKGEYEIFEWNLGGTFNYAEMAALICPRPFMVERGHFDGVGPDEQVAFEFAKVRNLYAARLNIGERCEIEWFAGPHTINEVATYDFLHRHLDWPKPEDSSPKK